MTLSAYISMSSLRFSKNSAGTLCSRLIPRAIQRTSGSWLPSAWCWRPSMSRSAGFTLLRSFIKSKVGVKLNLRCSEEVKLKSIFWTSSISIWCSWRLWILSTSTLESGTAACQPLVAKYQRFHNLREAAVSKPKSKPWPSSSAICLSQILVNKLQ